jgi:hypothetical protein
MFLATHNVHVGGSRGGASVVDTGDATAREVFAPTQRICLPDPLDRAGDGRRTNVDSSLR